MIKYKIISLFILFLIVLGNKINAQQYNQVGYLPSSVKRIFLPKKFQNKDYSITNESGKPVFSGKISKAAYWEPSGTKVCVADFSSLQNEGKYALKLADHSDELVFVIDVDSYKKVGSDAVKTFYHARASMPITSEFGGAYARPAGHPDDQVMIHASAASAQRPTGTTISSPGGWYDAGDYNKYIVNSSISTYTLIQAVNLYTTYANGLDLDIPESSNEVPDVLDEAIYNLRWMLTMQDTNDGGVYHKLTSKRFCGMIMPHKDNLDRYVVMKSTAATLDFAATMANASSLLSEYQDAFPGLADSCLQAAQGAWDWALQHPAVLYKQPADISTGEYKDSEISDEWLWAATELYLATGDAGYKKQIHLNSIKFTVPQWGKVSTLSLFSILTSDLKDQGLKALAERKYMALVNQYYQQYEKAAYKVSIVKFPWGSNGEISNQGILFLHAYRITADKKYLQAAEACLGYLLGANPTGYCFVTGHGKKSPSHIHERRTESDGIDLPLPGFLVGGPTLQAQKDCGKENYPSQFPAMAYLDNECSYSTNEIAINWNAPFVFLVMGIDAEMAK